MAKKLTNTEIEVLKNVQKFLTKPLKQKWVVDRKIRQLSIELNSDEHQFQIYMRQSILDEDNFSCGISLLDNGNREVVPLV